MKILMSLLLVSTMVLVASAQESLAVGDVAPDFNLKNIDNTLVSLNNSFNDSKGVILVFTCNTCPFAVKYEERIIELDNAFRPIGYPVVAINPNDVSIKPGDSFDEMIKRAEELNFPFQYLYDETQEVAAAYGATRTPQTYLLHRNADNFTVAYIGAIDNNTEDASAATEHYVNSAIQALENGDLPNPDFTKAIGCTIKWKIQ